jgi:hypothetical protein
MNHLHDRLDQAADDTGRPVTTDPVELLGRARASRRRRRQLGTSAVVVGAAALTVAAVLVPSLVQGGTDKPAEAVRSLPAATGETSDPEPAILGDSEIVRRCEAQLQKYFAYPMYAPSKWKVGHDREYAAGDLVQLEDGQFGSNPVLCVIPEKGREQQEVPFARFAGDLGQPGALAELCSESLTSFTAGEPWVDLRDAEVVAADGDRDVTNALLRLGNAYYSCSIAPPTWDVGLTDVYSTGRGEVYFNASTTGSSNKSIVGAAASYYTGAGLTDPAAEKLRVTFADGTVVERPVGDDGAYAVMIRLPGEGGVLDHTIEVLGAGERVLDEFGPM